MHRYALPALALLAAIGTAPAFAQSSERAAPGAVSGRAAPHIDRQTGDGPEVHRPVPTPGSADARTAPHIDNTTDGPRSHQPGPSPRSAAAGPAPHIDNTVDGPTSHRPGDPGRAH